MQKEFRLEDYVDKQTGFIPAAVFSEKSEMIQYQFWRDVELVFRAVDFETKKLIAKGLETYISKNKWGFSNFEKRDWSKEKSYLPPLCNKHFETPISDWMFHQNDAVGSKLYIASELKNREIADKLIEYLEFRRFYMDKDAGIWEGDSPLDFDGQKIEKRLRASSICACAKGIDAYEKNFEKTNVTKYLLEKAYDAVGKILPCECLATDTERAQDSNLALLFALAIDPILPIKGDKGLQEKMWENIIKLKRKGGFIRFHGDRWDGVRHHAIGEIEPMIWPIGNGLAYFYTGESEYLKESREIIRKCGYAPEGILNVGTKEKPNYVANGTHLLEGRAVHKLGEMKAVA